LIDKADLRVVAGTKFTPQFLNLEHLVGDKLWRPSKAYARAADFSEFGIPAILHYGCKLSKVPNHKIELLSTGDKPFSELRDTVAQIFQGDPEALAVVRADLTADVPGTTVHWFRDHTYFGYKRIVRELGEIPPMSVQHVRHSQAQTLYGGKKPNQLRIYDKVGEEMHRYVSYVRKLQNQHRRSDTGWGMLSIDGEQGWVSELEIPTFEQWSGRYHTGQILTRVERQCHGRDLAKLEITNFDSLRTADRIRPFTRLNFREDKDEFWGLSRDKWSMADWYIGDGMRRDVTALGLDRFIQELKRVRRTNWRRDFNKFEPFIRAAVSSYTEQGTDPIKLQAEFVRSTQLQMAA
jgi:hypothetical protein